jgi:cytochrome c5
MKGIQRFALASVLPLVVLSCSTTTDDPMRVLDTTGVAPVPTAEMASRAGESLDKVGSGYWIFQRKCLECHEARVPEDASLAAWHPTMIGMSWNAGLSEAEEDALLAYMRAAAPKAR